MPQFYKGDATELKYYNSGKDIIEGINLQLDEFFEDAYNCFLLGDMIYDNEFSPLARAIPREIFRESFSTIFDSFLLAGSFESYLVVFRKIFGDDVVVEFTVPGPGRLQIDIEAQGLVLSDFVARTIEANNYVFDEVVDDEGDNIVFQTIKGFESQYELERMLFEMVPDGIYTEITLTLGS